MVDADLVHGWSFCAMSQYSIDVFNLLLYMRENFWLQYMS